jgi:hypothetical protein
MEVNSKYYSSYNPDAPPDWEMHNKGITPMFFTEDVKLFEADGKTPRHGPDGKCTREQEYCRILIAGDGLCEASHIVDDLIKERFADEYQAWKEGREAAQQGHSLEEWPPLFSRRHGDLPPPKLIAEMHVNNIFTVEHLAALTDGNVTCFHGAREWREKAIVWLRELEGARPMVELAAAKAQMERDMEVLRAQITKLTAARRPKRKKQMSGAMRRKLNEARVRNAPKPATEQPSSPEAA